MQNRVLGCWLHEGDSESQTLQDDFLEELFKKCKFQTANIVAVVSDTTSNMNKFGTLLEKLDIPHIYCTDHVLQLTAKNAYLDSWYNETVAAGVATNDAEDLNWMKSWNCSLWQKRDPWWSTSHGLHRR